MPLMLSKLYDALLEAGASQEKAREAAEEAASHYDAFISLEAKAESVRESIVINRWLIGLMLVLVMFVLGMTFNQGAKLSRIETRLEQMAPSAKGN